MGYVTFKKLYYTVPDMLDKTYLCRYNSDIARHFDIKIKELNHKKEYPAFICYTEEIAALLEKIYTKYLSLLSIIHAAPSVVLHQFSLMCIVDEVKSTNDIEGVNSTRRQIKAILDGTVPRPARLISVVNKYKNLLSLEYISFNSCSDIRKFYDSFAHEEVCFDNPSNRLDGKIFRKDSVDVTSPTGKTIHRGVYPENKLIENMEIAIGILHDEKIPMLIRISIFHYFFAYLHPFYDGNGRTDRFITSYFLSRHLHPIAALRLSVTLKKYRKKYYDMFKECDSELNRGDITPFTQYFLSMIATSLEDTYFLLERKNNQLEKYKKWINENIKDDELTQNIYYILLQASLFYGQGVTIKQIMELTKKARGTVQKRLYKIPKKHINKTKIYNQYYYKLNMLILKN